MCPCPKCEDTYEEMEFGDYDDPQPSVPSTERESDVFGQCEAYMVGGRIRCDRRHTSYNKYCHNHQNWTIKENIERFCSLCGEQIPTWRRLSSKYCSKTCNDKVHKQKWGRKK